MITVEWWEFVIAPIILYVLKSLCGNFLTCGNDLCENALTCLCAKLGYKGKLEQDLDLLRNALDDLTRDREAVSSRAGDEEINGREKLPNVATWLLEVEAIETDTKLLIDEASGQDASAVDQQLPTSGGCPSTDNISNLSIGKRVSKKLDEVRNLSSTGKKFEVVTMKAHLPVVENRNVDAIGLDATLTRIWEKLKKDKILGIYGVGGVGKTTLLSRINNEINKEMGNIFDVVIWVEVSRRDVEIEKIQDAICERLRICDEKWSTYTKQEKAAKISSFITIKKLRFVLLLDGLWKEVSLSYIGIPLRKSEYRVVFTTRSLDVCRRMGSEDIEVECLSENDAWELFKRKARFSTSDEEILGVAEKVAAKCGGLPLALVVIGKAMPFKQNIIEKWQRALDTLDASPSEINGIEEEMFTVLKLSYDYLKNDVAKLGFQYCALFPKAHDIIREELVEYWIGERIIDVTNGRDWAMRQGNNTIDDLVEAGLLIEDAGSEQKAYMHDMIQEMAVWMVSKADSEERYVVKTRAELSQLPDVAEWISVKKMSLMNNKIEGIPNNPEFCGKARLNTLFLQHNKLDDIVGRFFKLLSTLVVLDLSHNLAITKLPEDISELVTLRYLSLLKTMIIVLPDGLGKLTKLIHLDLESTSNLRSIGPLISGLSELQVFKFADSFASLDNSLLNDLEGLKGLQLLTITVEEVDVLEAFLESNLAGKTKSLYLEDLVVSGASFAAIGALDRLSKLEMVRCDITESEIVECEGSTRDQHFPSGPSNQIHTSLAATGASLDSLSNPDMVKCDIITESEIVECEGSSRDQHVPSGTSNEIPPSNPWFKNLKSVVLLSCIQVKDLTWLIYATNLESLHVESSPLLKEIVNQQKAEGVIVNAKPFQKLQTIRLRHLGELIFTWSRRTFPKLKVNEGDIENCGPSTRSDEFVES